MEETGAEVVGPKGETLIRYGVLGNEAGSETTTLGLTRELEIMRGDIVKVLYETSLSDREKIRRRGDTSGSLTYLFNTTLTSLLPTPTGTTVTFSSSPSSPPSHYDLVVGADGQNSSTRVLAFGKSTSDASITPLDAHVAYFRIPASPSDTSIAKFYLASKSRAIMLRNGGQPQSQIYLFTTGAKAPVSPRASTVEQKGAWGALFEGAGWEIERVLEGMRDTEDFYTHPLIQIKLPSLVKGRVALLGDAGYCPSVLTGKGTTSSLIGAWVLAGELARRPGDVEGALGAYDGVMKEVVGRAQILGSQMRLPERGWVVYGVRWGLWVAGWVGVERLVRLGKWVGIGGEEEGGLEGWELPEYPEMGLEGWVGDEGREI